MEQKESRGHYSFMILHVTANYKQNLMLLVVYYNGHSTCSIHGHNNKVQYICTVTALYLFLFFPFHDCCITALTLLFNFTNIPQ